MPDSWDLKGRKRKFNTRERREGHLTKNYPLGTRSGFFIRKIGFLEFVPMMPLAKGNQGKRVEKLIEGYYPRFVVFRCLERFEGFRRVWVGGKITPRTSRRGENGHWEQFGACPTGYLRAQFFDIFGEKLSFTFFLGSRGHMCPHAIKGLP